MDFGVFHLAPCEALQLGQLKERRIICSKHLDAVSEHYLQPDGLAVRENYSTFEARLFAIDHTEKKCVSLGAVLIDKDTIGWNFVFRALEVDFVRVLVRTMSIQLAS